MELIQVFWICAVVDASGQRVVSHLGGLNSDGSCWELSAAAALAGMAAQELRFYVIRKGRILDLIAGDRNGNPFLKCETDDDAPTQLLRLPKFQPLGPCVVCLDSGGHVQ